MTKLDDILNEIGDALYWEGSEREEEHERIIASAKQQIKEIVRTLIDETFTKDDKKAYEFWQKVSEL